jgi:mono/diheme cytochrome c family protein
MKTIKKIAKWLGYIVASVLLICLALYGYIYWNIEQRLHKVYSTATPVITIPSDSASIKRGEHLFVVHGCKDCHGTDLKGRYMVNETLIGKVAAQNITKGKGGLPADYSDQDWLRVLKHGVNREGRTLIIMPANETTLLADKDLADIIAYCKSRPPKDHLLDKTPELGPVLKTLIAFDKLDLLPAEHINHQLNPVAEKKAEVSVAYGAYLTTNCATCHRTNFQGGPPLAPGAPEVPNITSTGRVGKWSEVEFMQTLRTGITPDGHAIDSTQMPWPRTREFSDVELKAVREFLLSLPANRESLGLK